MLAAEISAPSLPVAAETKRLLIVDDHPIFRHGIGQLIGKLPEVTICAQAQNAQEALEAMRKHRPEVVLLDVSMPGVNGFEAARHLRDSPGLRGVVVVAMTGLDEALFRRLGAGDEPLFHLYLQKPVCPEQLEQVLASRASIGVGGDEL